MIMPERSAVGVGVEVIAERGVQLLQLHQITRRFLVEAMQVAQHRPETRPYEVAPFGKKSSKIAARIFKLPTGDRYGKRHVGQLSRHLQMREQRREVRIGLFVVDNEAGIDRDRSGRGLDRDRVRVPANSRVAFKDRNVVPLTE